MRSLLERGIPERAPLDLAFLPELNRWNGYDRIQLRIRDLRISDRGNVEMPNQAVMDIDQLLDRVKSYNAEADLGVVRKAYEFWAKVHEGQRRRSGEPYLQHPIALAGVLTSLKTDVTAID